MLLYSKEIEQIGIVTWLLTTVLICTDPLCGLYTVTSDPKTALTLSLHVDLVISEPRNQG